MGFFGPSKAEKAQREQYRQTALQAERTFLKESQKDLSRAVRHKDRNGIEAAKEEIRWRQRAIRGHGG